MQDLARSCFYLAFPFPASFQPIIPSCIGQTIAPPDLIHTPALDHEKGPRKAPSGNLPQACSTAQSRVKSRENSAFAAANSAMIRPRSRFVRQFESSARNSSICCSMLMDCLLIVARQEACPAPRVPGQGPQSGRASGDGGHDFSGAERGQDDAIISRPPPKNGGAPSSLRRCARRRIMGGPQQTSSPDLSNLAADDAAYERPGQGKRPRNLGGCGAGRLPYSPGFQMIA